MERESQKDRQCALPVVITNPLLAPWYIYSPRKSNIHSLKSAQHKTYIYIVINKYKNEYKYIYWYQKF